MIYIAYTLHIITCIFLILVVLLQQGKGADLSVFGGGSTQAAFGARGAATLLHKLTVAFFILFMITTVSIGVLQRGRRASSVMKGVAPASQPATSTEPAPAEPAAGAPAEAAPPAAEAAPAPQDGAAAQPNAANGDATGSASAPPAQAPAEPAAPSGATQPQSP